MSLSLAEKGVLASPAHDKNLLRFITCGSVDDGKSTLIGRLLHDSKSLFDDQLATLHADSRRSGGVQGQIDFSLLLDGLAAEREQKITIDVAYRFFATQRRSFIVADTPGHEQYTRNMVTGASTASLAIVLVDARKGILTQTRRHAYLASLLGIRHLVLAVNKMDAVDWRQSRFAEIVQAFRAFSADLTLHDVTAIPLSALLGANVTSPGNQMPWYTGPTLLNHLEDVPVESQSLRQGAFRMSVQWVNRPDADFRGFAGTVAAGTVQPGALVRVLPSGRQTSVARIVTYDGDLDEAVGGQAVTLTFSDEIDCSRGDMIAAANAAPEIADKFQATLVWMVEAPLRPGRSYWLKIGRKTVVCTVTRLKHRVDVNSLAEQQTTLLQLNEIGVCHISLDQAIPFDSYAENRETGGFILIDRMSHATVAAGLLHFALRRSQNLHWQAVDVDRTVRAAAKEQRPALVWFTGLSGAGKSTIANLVEKRLHVLGRHTYLLDGDNVRHGLNRDLGFTDADRVENIRRVAEVGRLMVDAGLIVLASLISPFRADRAAARALLNEGEFFEVFVDTTLSVAEQRDPKGLYRKARSGALRNFTGIDSPYEVPEKPELRVDTSQTSAEDAAEQVIAALRAAGIIW
jgi:bifunctional enzyme CysN/CysC